MNQKYYVCSVSTCNRVRTELVFCSVACFDSHVPVMNHRDAGAIEKTARPSPVTTSQTQTAQRTALNPPPKVALQSIPSSKPNASSQEGDEILVVVSKVKAYIRDRSGMNTSDNVMNILTRKVRMWCDAATQHAIQKGRKTVLDRDVS